MNPIAPPKLGKSWLVETRAIAVAQGTDRQRKVSEARAEDLSCVSNPVVGMAIGIPSEARAAYASMIANGAAFVRLCFLSPTIIEGLAIGRFTHLSINKMIPVTTQIWSEQRALLGVD